MSSVASGVDLLYSWHDFMESHADQRNAFIRTGRFVQEDMPDLRWDSYDFRMKKKAHHPLLKRMPCAYTRRTTSWLNRYFYKLESRSASQVQSIDRVLFPVKDRMVYYHLFGKAGVIEMQWLFPLDQWCSASIAIQTLVKDHVCPITLASGKLFRGTQKGLRFSGEGLCFSLNVPHHEKGLDFAHQMDLLGIAFKAKPNIIKDSRLSAEVLRSCYPDCDSTIKGFRKYDSQQRFQTELSKRLEL
jgi:hypothetical protein